MPWLAAAHSRHPPQAPAPQSAPVMHFRSVVLNDSKTDPDAHAMITNPLSETTLKSMCVARQHLSLTLHHTRPTAAQTLYLPLMRRCRHAKYLAAGKQKDSWSMAQTLNLLVDRISLLKEEQGRYYHGNRCTQHTHF